MADRIDRVTGRHIADQVAQQEALARSGAAIAQLVGNAVSTAHHYSAAVRQIVYAQSVFMGYGATSPTGASAAATTGAGSVAAGSVAEGSDPSNPVSVINNALGLADAPDADHLIAYAQALAAANWKPGSTEAGGVAATQATQMRNIVAAVAAKVSGCTTEADLVNWLKANITNGPPFSAGGATGSVDWKAVLSGLNLVTADGKIAGPADVNSHIALASNTFRSNFLTTDASAPAYNKILAALNLSQDYTPGVSQLNNLIMGLVPSLSIQQSFMVGLSANNTVSQMAKDLLANIQGMPDTSPPIGYKCDAFLNSLVPIIMSAQQAFGSTSSDPNSTVAAKAEAYLKQVAPNLKMPFFLGDLNQSADASQLDKSVANAIVGAVSSLSITVTTGYDDNDNPITVDIGQALRTSVSEYLTGKTPQIDIVDIGGDLAKALTLTAKDPNDPQQVTKAKEDIAQNMRAVTQALASVQTQVGTTLSSSGQTLSTVVTQGNSNLNNMVSTMSAVISIQQAMMSNICQMLSLRG